MRTKDIEAAIERVWAKHRYSFEDKTCACGASMPYTEHEMHVAVAVWRSART